MIHLIKMADEARGGTSVHICSYPGCLKTFSRPNRLIIHIRSHTGEKPFKCEVEGCGKQYARSTHLSRHQDNAHCDLEKLGDIKCPVEGCGMKFTLSQNLTKHLKRRHEAVIFQCDVPGCGKTFKKHQHLKVHGFDHTGINPFLCTHEGCGMRFRVPSKLHRHEKVHTGYSCDVAGCSAHFTKWTLLRKHRAADHTSVLEHKCDECGKLFSQRQWLKQHMKVHSETRDIFACPRENCGRSYLDQRNLLAHIRSYHDGRRFPCQHEGCERKFTSEQKLKQHRQEHDVNKPPPKKKSKKSRKKSLPARLFGIDAEATETMEVDKIELSDIVLRAVDTVSVTVASHTQTCDTVTHVISHEGKSVECSDQKHHDSDVGVLQFCQHCKYKKNLCSCISSTPTVTNCSENLLVSSSDCKQCGVKQSENSYIVKTADDQEKSNNNTREADHGKTSCEINDNTSSCGEKQSVNISNCSVVGEMTERTIC